MDMGNTWGTSSPTVHQFHYAIGLPELKTANSKMKPPPPSEIQRERHEDFGHFGKDLLWVCGYTKPANIGPISRHVGPLSG